MLALYFVGLGLSGVKGLSLEGSEALRACRVVYLERYTNPSAPSAKELEYALGRGVVEASRELVEDGRLILREAREGGVALVSSGDPMVATTHQELRIRAARDGIATHIIHSASIASAIAGEIGLHHYKFGKTITVTSSTQALNSVLDTVYSNLLKGLHTLLLLEYSSNSALRPGEALKRLVEADEALGMGVFSQRLFVVVAARVCQEDQFVKAGLLGELAGEDYGSPPYSIVVPGRLHFTEAEALETLLHARVEEADNTLLVKSRARVMVPRYVEKTNLALRRVRAMLSGRKDTSRLNDLLENVECYASDAMRFINEGKEELAVLSIGYAEGLLDSLRLLGLVEVPW